MPLFRESTPVHFTPRFACDVMPLMFACHHCLPVLISDDYFSFACRSPDAVATRHYFSFSAHDFHAQVRYAIFFAMIADARARFHAATPPFARRFMRIAPQRVACLMRTTQAGGNAAFDDALYSGYAPSSRVRAEAGAAAAFCRRSR
jgi:hypothetical protein